MIFVLTEHRQLAPQLPDYEDVDLAEAPPPIRSHRVDSSEAPPPVPPQRLDTGDIRELQLNRQTLDEYNVDGGQRLSKSPKSSLRRTSSAGELQDSIKHLQVNSITTYIVYEHVHAAYMYTCILCIMYNVMYSYSIYYAWLYKYRLEKGNMR